MFLLAHTGITLGIFSLCHRVFSKLHSHMLFSISSVNGSPTPNPKKWHIDYRLILLGSIFPDIVDRPLGMLIFANLISNGRVYTHTLLVNLILVLIGVYLLKRKRPNFLIFALSSFFHLILDRMWVIPQTLFWPFCGWGFPKQDVSHWWQGIFQALFTDPWTYWPEIIGAIILVRFGMMLVRKGMVGKFLLEGVHP